MNTYTPEQREEALRLYEEAGPAEASRQSGVPARTVVRWATRAGLTRRRLEKTSAATEMLTITNAQRREKIREKLLIRVDELLDRLGLEVGARDVQSLAIAFGVLLDKYRLELGEATGRMENLDLSAAERRIEVEIERLSAEMATQGGEPTLEPATEGAIGT